MPPSRRFTRGGSPVRSKNGPVIGAGRLPIQHHCHARRQDRHSGRQPGHRRRDRNANRRSRDAIRAGSKDQVKRSAAAALRTRSVAVEGVLLGAIPEKLAGVSGVGFRSRARIATSSTVSWWPSPGTRKAKAAGSQRHQRQQRHDQHGAPGPDCRADSADTLRRPQLKMHDRCVLRRGTRDGGVRSGITPSDSSGLARGLRAGSARSAPTRVAPG